MDIKKYLNEKSKIVDAFLKSYFERPVGDAPNVLCQSMQYSLLAGGKRVRPILAMASYEACGGNGNDIVECASAIEVIHTYSLIHDDLPAMDNDDLRRGRPTSHKVFGEAVAILTGDALLTEAFLMILNSDGKISDKAKMEAIRELSLASGVRGMVGGQVQDILSEDQEPDEKTLFYIHKHKTGALMKASVRMGGIVANAGSALMEALSNYGEHLGYAFQVVDDILNVKGDENMLGKPVGSDREKNKMTYPALYGIEKSKKMAEELTDKALNALKPIEGKVEALKEIAIYILERQN